MRLLKTLFLYFHYHSTFIWNMNYIRPSKFTPFDKELKRMNSFDATNPNSPYSPIYCKNNLICNYVDRLYRIYAVIGEKDEDTKLLERYKTKPSIQVEPKFLQAQYESWIHYECVRISYYNHRLIEEILNMGDRFNVPFDLLKFFYHEFMLPMIPDIIKEDCMVAYFYLLNEARWDMPPFLTELDKEYIFWEMIYVRNKLWYKGDDKNEIIPLQHNNLSFHKHNLGFYYTDRMRYFIKRPLEGIELKQFSKDMLKRYMRWCINKNKMWKYLAEADKYFPYFNYVPLFSGYM